MAKNTYGAEEARALLPKLLEQAHHGKASIVTKRGKPYAQIVPPDLGAPRRAKQTMLSLSGSGRGLWGRNSRRAIRRLRDEWE